MVYVEPVLNKEAYTSSVRPVREYAVSVWQSIPGYLSEKIESVQKRALKIIFPCADRSMRVVYLLECEWTPGSVKGNVSNMFKDI